MCKLSKDGHWPDCNCDKCHNERRYPGINIDLLMSPLFQKIPPFDLGDLLDMEKAPWPDE